MWKDKDNARLHRWQKHWIEQDRRKQRFKKAIEDTLWNSMSKDNQKTLNNNMTRDSKVDVSQVEPDINDQSKE